jgi:hypothetical protein
VNATWRQRLLLMAFGLILGLATLELGLRVTFFVRRTMGGMEAPREDLEGLPVLPNLFAMARPNVRGVVAGALYETNSHGIRGPERTIAKPPKTFRVAVVGDSFTMGNGVDYEETYAAKLELALGGLLPGRNVEVINFGISGLNLEAIVGRLRQVGLQFDPDLLVYGFTLNDIEGASYLYTMTSSQRRFGHRASSSFLWRLVRGNLVGLEEAIDPPEDSYPYELRVNYFDNTRAWGAFKAGLEALGTIAKTREICAAMLVHTQITMLNGLHPFLDVYDRVAKAAQAGGLHPIQSFPEYRGRFGLPLWVSLIDSHPNGRGHDLLLRALLRGLRELPESCWPEPLLASPLEVARDS